MRRISERGGLFYEFKKGISLGCPLSPFIGTLHLKQLDEQFTLSDFFYVRYMDDILVMAKTRWKLKKPLALSINT